MNEPLKLVFLPGVTAEQLREALERWPYYQGIPVLPGAYDVQIVELPPQCAEPDIEDEP